MAVLPDHTAVLPVNEKILRMANIMKVAHFAIVTPRLCGLYETARELVKALRDQGIDSRIVDPKPINDIRRKVDRGALIEDLEWANEADVLVSHSGLGKMEDCGIPIIHIAHGRPRHSFLTEAGGGTPIYSYHYDTNKKEQFKSIVTFWRQHKPYLQVMYPDKPVYVVQSPVDLDFWKPAKSDYEFPKGGDINIVCTDAFRNDIDCYEPLNAYALWARQNKSLNPKLHIFGKPKGMKGWGALIRRIQDDGNMGIIQGWAAELQRVYQAADLLITGHQIDVRSVREAMACGCPVVRIKDIENPGITEGLKQKRMRAKAVRLFNAQESAKQFIEILNHATECKVAQ